MLGTRSGTMETQSRLRADLKFGAVARLRQGGQHGRAVAGLVAQLWVADLRVEQQADDVPLTATRHTTKSVFHSLQFYQNTTRSRFSWPTSKRRRPRSLPHGRAGSTSFKNQ